MTKYAKGDVLYVPVVEQIDLFIDDTGDNAIGVAGFTVLLIDEYTRNDIRPKMMELLKREGVTTIHVSRMSGSILKRLLLSSMKILLSELKRASYGYIRWMLSPSDVMETISQQLAPLADEVLKKGRGGVAASDPIGKLFTYVAVPTLEILSRATCDKDIKINIFIENKGHYRKLSNKRLFMGLGYVEIAQVLRHLLDIYVKKVHKLTCSINDVQVVKSGSSPMLDIMDVVGNLTLNFFRSTLQISAGMSLSKSSKMKLRIFEDILSEINDKEYVNSLKTKIQSSFSLSGNSLIPTNPNARISVFEIMQIQGQ